MNRASRKLIRRTRNSREFPLVYTGLVEYGALRNLLGIKVFGVMFALVGLVVAAWSTFTGWTTLSALPVISIVAAAFAIGCLLCGQHG